MTGRPVLRRNDETAAAKAPPPAASRAKDGHPPAGKADAKPADAIRLLKDDHREVAAWFKAYEKLETPAEKQALADKICRGLSVHMMVEEELFYPAVRPEFDDESQFDEAEVEHGSAKHLIAEIRSMKAGVPQFCAKVKVLGEYIAHHVEEEETEMFPRTRETKIDLKALGARMAELKATLTKESAV